MNQPSPQEPGTILQDTGGRTPEASEIIRAAMSVTGPFCLEPRGMAASSEFQRMRQSRRVWDSAVNLPACRAQAESFGRAFPLQQDCPEGGASGQRGMCSGLKAWYYSVLVGLDYLGHITPSFFLPLE